MKIAIIGTGNVGMALAQGWHRAGHAIVFGVRAPEQTKGLDTALALGIPVLPVPTAVQKADVLVLATPAMAAIEVAQSLGDTHGKILIDTMNIVMGRGPADYDNTTQAIADHTETNDIVKCFNSTGFNNMLDPHINGQALDMFMAGDSEEAQAVARQLALDLGFAHCYTIGGNAQWHMLEQFANVWIHLALMQGQGRDIGFKLLKKML